MKITKISVVALLDDGSTRVVPLTAKQSKMILDQVAIIQGGHIRVSTQQIDIDSLFKTSEIKQSLIGRIKRFFVK